MIVKHLCLASMAFIAFFNSLHASQEENDVQAFYAISSLRYYLEQIDSPQSDVEEPICFDENDISALWNKALQSSESLKVMHAFNIFQKGLVSKDEAQTSQTLLSHSRTVLNEVWQKLNADYFGNNPLSKAPEASPMLAFQNKADPDARFYLRHRQLLTSKLDQLFGPLQALENAANLEKAGFTIISHRPSTMRVVAHPQMPGYLFKLYLQDEKENRHRTMKWATDRCLGVENIRKLIKIEHLTHFTVPKKRIYFLPDRETLIANDIQNYVVLVVTDMQLVSRAESKAAWATLANKEHLDQLYRILSRGFSSCYLPGNIPFTKKGKFACIDTENPERKLPYNHVKKHLSDEMKIYWDKLVRAGGVTTGFKVTEAHIGLGK